MQVRDLAEIAALIAVRSEALIQSATRVPPPSNEEYWAASRCRLDRWGRLLRSLSSAEDEPRLPATLAWPRVGPVLEEMLATELLTRVWAAVATAYDAAHGEQELEPVARSVFVGHLDARRRLLSLISNARVIEPTHAAKLNHLRRRVERWTDLLLGHVSEFVELKEFAFDPNRARDFADDLHRDAAEADRQFTLNLVLLSLRASFAEGLTSRSPNGDLNRRIGAALLGAFGEEAPPPFQSIWLDRIARTAEDTENMVEELLRLHQN